MTPYLQHYQKLSEIGNLLNRWIGQAVSWMTLVMVIVTASIVIFRMLFNANSIAAQELVTYLHAIVIMAACAYTLAEDEHVRVDIFYRRFTPANKAWVDLIGSILFLLPFAVATIAVSWNFILDSWATQESSNDAGGIPAVFILKSLLLVNGALLTLQCLANILNYLTIITNAQYPAMVQQPKVNKEPSCG